MEMQEIAEEAKLRKCSRSMDKESDSNLSKDKSKRSKTEVNVDKAKVKWRIVFKDESKNNNSNDNATKAVEVESLRKDKKVKSVNKDLKHNTQVQSKPVSNHDIFDGIQTEVEGHVEDLDYVDDVLSEDKGSIFGADEDVTETVTTLIEQPEITEQRVDKQCQEPVPGTSGVGGMQSATSNDALPQFQIWFQQMFDQRMGNATSSGNVMGRSPSVGNKGNNKCKQSRNVKVRDSAKVKEQTEIIKSPSDTTIYAPAVARNTFQDNSPVTQLQGNVVNRLINEKTTENGDGHHDAVINDVISNFVESIRMEQNGRSGYENNQELRVTAQNNEHQRVSTTGGNPEQDEARRHTQSALIEAEKFKATIAQVPGEQQNSVGFMNDSVPMCIPNIGSRVSDDDFFHLMCHIDPSLFHKMKRGSMWIWRSYCQKTKLIDILRKTD